MKTLADYTVVVMPDDGTWVAYVPAMDGCQAMGESPEAARHELEGVFEAFRSILEEDGLPLPPDVKALTPVAG